MNIRDRIAKLLALSESPNEHEAKAALLKARELMATHKLRPEDVLDAKEQKVIRKTIRASCTKMTNKWAVELSAVIAPLQGILQSDKAHKNGNHRLYWPRR